MEAIQRFDRQCDSELRKAARRLLCPPSLTGGVRVVVGCPVSLALVALSLLATLLNPLASTALMLPSWSSMSIAGSYRLFTWIVAHRDWAHFSGNASILLMISPLLEARYGSCMLLKIILACGGITGVLAMVLMPAGVGLLGASGVCIAFVLLSAAQGTASVATHGADGSVSGVAVREVPLCFILCAVMTTWRELLGMLRCARAAGQCG